MKRFRLSSLVVVLSAIVLIVSCEDTPAISDIVEYSTPTIKGTITIPDGSDVKPDEVYVKVIDSDDKTVTIQKASSDGTFVIQNLSQDMTYKILFTSEEPEFNNRSVTRGKGSGVGGWLKDVVPAVKEGNNVGSVKMKPLGTIKGRVTVDGKAEHYDTTVYIPGTSYSAITDKDGNFSIYSVPEGTYTLRYTHEDCVAYMMQNVMLVCPDDVENPEKTVGNVVLRSSRGTVQGKAVLGDADDSTGITIKLESEDKSTSYDSSTSSNGNYTINGVTPGRYRVIASYSTYLSQSTGYFDVSAATVTSVPEQLELLGDYGTIKGKVSLGDSDVKEGIQILIRDNSSTNSYAVTTDETGSFIKKVKPGEYTVTALRMDYASKTKIVTVMVDSITELSFNSLVSLNGTVSGFVTLEGSSDNSGVIITLTDSSDSENVYSEVSASDGSFRITGIKKTSNYLLTYSKDGYVSNLSNSVDVTVGKVVTADLVTLKSVMSTVSGKIQLEGASSYENTTILLKSGDNDYTATTNQKGEYRINGVLPGTYMLLASKNGYVTASTKEFVVESSSEKEVELLSLSVAVRSVTGNVTLELGTDHAGALVTATNLSDSKIVYSAITNSDGDYTLAGMVPGEYQIVISKSGYVTATLATTNIVANTLTDVGSTELAIAKGEITGIARLEGCSDYSGITVSIVGTTFSTTTAKDGTYSFTVPTGNYSGGIRYEYEDFETTSYVANIAVLQTTSYSDAYAVPDQELKCINVPKVSGKVSVAGSTKVQYEDITISIVELPEFTFTTEADGKYTFEHVPVGTYTFEFTRENARKVTKMVAIEPSLEITIEDIELIPDAVTLYGNISLSGLSDYSGVTVRVTTSDSVELKTVTNAAGYWYIGNIIASKEHTIYFEKSGWATKSYAIAANTYEPMSLNDCTSTYPVVLEDKVSPVITSLTATVGKSTEDGREVYLYLYTQEEGSGIKCIQGNTSDSFDSITEQSYYNPFKLIIPDEVGDTTIYVRVKDAAGNISNTVSTNVTLKNDKTELYQTLSGDKLHLTYANSPYVMTDNILVPEGETLVIDPGVEIQVKGEYYIQVEGTLSAIGTADKHIKIYGVDEGQDKWKGIKIINDNDSQITYTEITGFTEGIQGYGTINNSILTATADGYVLGINSNYYDSTKGYWVDEEEYFKGSVLNTNISGKIYASSTEIIKNTIFSDSIRLSVSGSIFGNIFSGTLSGLIYGAIIQNTFNGTGLLTFDNVYMCNNEINLSKVEVKSSTVKYSTFNNVELSISGGSWSNNTLNNCSFESYSAGSFTDSNMIGCGTITITSKRLDVASYSMVRNYWGDEKTVELDQETSDDQISFFYHYSNDFNLTRIIWNDYLKTALTDCGYQGEGFDITTYAVGDIGPAGGYIFYDCDADNESGNADGLISTECGWRYLEATPSCIGSYAFGYYRPDGSTNTEVGTETAIGTGKANTEALVNAMGEQAYTSSSDDTKGKYAAKACLDYSRSYKGVVYDDWFLPSKDEFYAMYKQLGGSSYQWSSSECSNDFAWGQNFDDGSQGYYYRYANEDVRSIRAF